MLRLVRFLAVALAIAGLGLTTSSPVRSAPSGKPIVFGASISLTGRFADGGKYSLQGYELWVKQQNAKGGLLGRPVELKIYDDQSEPAVGVRLYERLVNEDKVDVLLGPYGSALTAPTANVAQRYKMAMFCPEDAAPETFSRGLDYVFQGLPVATYYVQGVIELAKQRGLKTVAYIGEDSPFPHAVGGSVNDLVKSAGMSLVYSEYYPPRNSDFSSTIQKVKAANPDVLLAGAFAPDSIAILRQLKQTNFAPKMVYEAIGPSDPTFATSAGSDANGIMSSAPWSANIKTPANAAFVKAFQAEYNRMPDYHSASNYSGMMVIAAAINKVGSIDQQKIRDTLSSIKMPTLLGYYQVDAKTGVQTGYRALIQQWQNGTNTVVYGNQSPAKPIFPLPAWSGR